MGAALALPGGLVHAPTDGQSHLYAQFYPPYRTRNQLKYLTDTEIGAGFFAMDATLEEKTLELQQVKIRF